MTQVAIVHVRYITVSTTTREMHHVHTHLHSFYLSRFVEQKWRIFSVSTCTFSYTELKLVQINPNFMKIIMFGFGKLFQ